MVAVRSSQVIVCDVYFTDTKTSYMDYDVGLAFRSVQTHFARRRPYRVATHPGPWRGRPACTGMAVVARSPCQRMISAACCGAKVGCTRKTHATMTAATNACAIIGTTNTTITNTGGVVVAHSEMDGGGTARAQSEVYAAETMSATTIFIAEIAAVTTTATTAIAEMDGGGTARAQSEVYAAETTSATAIFIAEVAAVTTMTTITVAASASASASATDATANPSGGGGGTTMVTTPGARTRRRAPCTTPTSPHSHHRCPCPSRRHPARLLHPTRSLTRRWKQPLINRPSRRQPTTRHCSWFPRNQGPRTRSCTGSSLRASSSSKDC